MGTHQLRPDYRGLPVLGVSRGLYPSSASVPARLAAAHRYAGGVWAGAGLA